METQITEKVRNTYLKEEVMGMSKEELVVKLYDVGIAGCLSKDERKVSKILAELIDSLNFDYGELPARLFRLYQYAMYEVKKGHFGETLNVLQDLRNTWVKTFKLEDKYPFMDAELSEEIEEK